MICELFQQSFLTLYENVYDGECDTGEEESVLVYTGLLLGLWFICEVLVNTVI